MESVEPVFRNVPALLRVRGRRITVGLPHLGRMQAVRCRRLVNLWPNRQPALISMAEEYDEKALAMEQRQ
jgi:hypothetical protein